jgi:hypothetical protein
LTQQEVADRLTEQGFARKATTISGWENENDVVPIELIPPLAKALEETSPVTLYELAGVLAHIPGNEIVKLLNGATPGQLRAVERIVAAYLKEENGL